ncbi:NAD-dependent epimerase [Pullulanibacillus sp. KACC 23026]|uniref:NAD-dependent epimerase n=1 Tax=Pullulanibacillus sp. KACC 23026 TaxID=3028315 RepID=UPI0023B1E8E1|nr:NAD-dependent epimerase [Pullulanibacillus sp. KACC 23026]WEG13565.1 NAD-dependent epimerase [Pullulanibacillus sp. KACC 23026]
MGEQPSILITGCTGFIGYHLSARLLKEGYQVIGLDNLNDYYDPSLKQDRLNLLKQESSFTFLKGSLENKELLELVFEQFKFDHVIHLAAQAGVRYSLDHPDTYIQSNLVGFANVLECCRKHHIQHLLYASSSSVYGNNKHIPFSTKDRVDQPISLYAATKKANEELAYTYSHLFNLPTTGLRFFTVYGPWGRPDMALFTFTKAITEGEPIKLFNHGNMRRDFTYIDDCVESIVRLLQKGPSLSTPPHEVFNIGNHQPVELSEFVAVLEKELGRSAIKENVPIQPGDVPVTYADTSDLEAAIHYRPTTTIQEGIKRFVAWYKAYYKLTD